MLSRLAPNILKIQSNQLKINRFLSTNQTTLSGKNNKTRNLFIFTVATTGSFLAYYELALNAQEKRKIRVNIQSIGRAFRALKVGLHVITDYKWNLWNLDDVL